MVFGLKKRPAIMEIPRITISPQNKIIVHREIFLVIRFIRLISFPPACPGTPSSTRHLIRFPKPRSRVAGSIRFRKTGVPNPHLRLKNRKNLNQTFSREIQNTKILPAFSEIQPPPLNLRNPAAGRPVAIGVHRLGHDLVARLII